MHTELEPIASADAAVHAESETDVAITPSALQLIPPPSIAPPMPMLMPAVVLAVLDIGIRARFVADANVRRSRTPPGSIVMTALVNTTR